MSSQRIVQLCTSTRTHNSSRALDTVVCEHLKMHCVVSKKLSNYILVRGHINSRSNMEHLKMHCVVSKKLSSPSNSFSATDSLRMSHTCIRPHTSAYVRIRLYTSAYASIRQKTSAHASTRQHTPAYVSISQLASIQHLHRFS